MREQFCNRYYFKISSSHLRIDIPRRILIFLILCLSWIMLNVLWPERQGKETKIIQVGKEEVKLSLACR